jgi:hypothetical protein
MVFSEIPTSLAISDIFILAPDCNRAGLDETTSISSRAFELYSQQKSPLEVAISMGLEAEDAIKYYKEFLMLLGITEFTMVYLQIKDNAIQFVNLFN